MIVYGTTLCQAGEFFSPSSITSTDLAHYTSRLKTHTEQLQALLTFHTHAHMCLTVAMLYGSLCRVLTWFKDNNWQSLSQLYYPTLSHITIPT